MHAAALLSLALPTAVAVGQAATYTVGTTTTTFPHHCERQRLSSSPGSAGAPHGRAAARTQNPSLSLPCPPCLEHGSSVPPSSSPPHVAASRGIFVSRRGGVRRLGTRLADAARRLASTPHPRPQGTHFQHSFLIDESPWIFCVFSGDFTIK